MAVVSKPNKMKKDSFLRTGIVSGVNAERLLVMGDVHGQYEKMLNVLSLCEYQPSNDRLILLGDYVDRGPDSRRVVSEVLRLVQLGAIALYGNHEDLMRQALRNRKHGYLNPTELEQWFANGGEITLESYRAHASELDAHLAFFADLPRWTEVAGYLCVHAGIRPDRKIEKQAPRDLIWIREEYIEGYRGPQDVVTGHTPVQYLRRFASFEDIEDSTKPLIREHKYFLDTGAAWHGPLTVMDLLSGEYWQA
jgi:serine/threonine protein phosphatase 1